MVISLAYWSGILAVLIVSVVPNNVYYVTTNSSGDSYSNTLKHYLDNPKKYFKSNSQLIFFPGEYKLNADLIFEGIRNFNVTAVNSCNIYCSSYASILVINVTKFELRNINLINCGKNHTISTRQGNSIVTNSYKFDYHNSSVLLYHCELVRIVSVNISVSAHFGAILAMNVKNSLIIDNVKVQLDCSGNHNFNYSTYGILLRYKNKGGKGRANVTINKFSYKVSGLCTHYSRYAIKVLLFQNIYNVSITIKDTDFHNLNHCSVLYYSVLICRLKLVEFELRIRNSTVSNNIGDSTNAMFHLQLSKPSCANSIYFKNEATKYFSIFSFIKCKFENNTNVPTMIYIIPASTAAFAGNIVIKNSQFIRNKDIHFIEVRGAAEIVPWQLSTYIRLNNTNVSFNEHHDGSSLISITNCLLNVYENSYMNNTYYENIFMLHLSTIIYSGYSVVAYNSIRYIMKTISGSYFIMKIGSVLNINNNNVYKIAKQMYTYRDITRPVCPIQFYDPRQVYDHHPEEIKIQVLMLQNVHTLSKGLPGSDLTFNNCTWLQGSSFQRINAEVVYKMVFTTEHIVVTKNSKRVIPLSVCPCFNSYSDCYNSTLKPIYPGQTLLVGLIVRKEYISKKQNSTTTLVVGNTLEDDCIITESYQLSQTHFSHGCNNYSYTIWPSHENITECKLFVGLMKMPEMFFVEIKQCPRGIYSAA